MNEKKELPETVICKCGNNLFRIETHAVIEKKKYKPQQKLDLMLMRKMIVCLDCGDWYKATMLEDMKNGKKGK